MFADATVEIVGVVSSSNFFRGRSQKGHLLPPSANIELLCLHLSAIACAGIEDLNP